MDSIEFLEMNYQKLFEATIRYYVERSIDMEFSFILLYVLFDKFYDAFTRKNHKIVIRSLVYVVQENFTPVCVFSFAINIENVRAFKMIYDIIDCLRCWRNTRRANA